jgi:hypothetical protein
MKSVLFTIILFLVNFSFAQKGNVQIIKDSKIDALISKQSEVVPPAVKPEIEGYRIQLFFDSNKSKLNASRATFISRYPKIDTYTSYNAPNFFLKAGDFRTRLEAEKIKSEIEAEFPTSFVVKERINLPRLNKDQE